MRDKEAMGNSIDRSIDWSKPDQKWFNQLIRLIDSFIRSFNCFHWLISFIQNPITTHSFIHSKTDHNSFIHSFIPFHSLPWTEPSIWFRFVLPIAANACAPAPPAPASASKSPRGCATMHLRFHHSPPCRARSDAEGSGADTPPFYRNLSGQCPINRGSGWLWESTASESGSALYILLKKSVGWYE